jgi:hypothetical protein
MADVQIQQTPTGERSGLGWLWAIIAIIAIALLAWFLFAGGRTTSSTNETKVDVSTPAGGASGTTKSPNP